MTTPGRLLDFFTLEASEYLTRLESLVTQQAMPAPDATHLAAAARGLRGSATMAKASELARLATSVERIAAGVVQGVTKWEPEVQRSMVGAIEDLKLLVRSVRTWGAEQDARVEESLQRLARYGPTREVRNDDVILPISQLFHNDDGPHVVYVAPNPKTHYEQQLRETGHIGPGKLSPEVKRMPTPAEARAASQAKTPPRGKELSDVLNSSLATMRSLENRNSGPQPQAAELVPIQELLYKGKRAIERAAEIRRALKKSGTAPTRALVDELVDLVELASAE
ncbi:MAG TPA: Hpt domain-containing protein [Gemmatimonadaceae bacterium]|jgi:chemotaxis protein histidine kinase CheA|nr:Hpt domain-containing protein [Gemmatimonadaceae bacterium]